MMSTIFMYIPDCHHPYRNDYLCQATNVVVVLIMQVLEEQTHLRLKDLHRKFLSLSSQHTEDSP